MKKIQQLKGFIIAVNKNGEYFVFTKEEYSHGEGFRYPEFECGNLQECIDNINTY